MAKKTAEELISQFSKIVGEETNEDILSMMDDIKDSVEVDPYEQKYNDLLKKYRDRFEASTDVEENNEVPDSSHDEVRDEILDTTIEDLLIED